MKAQIEKKKHFEIVVIQARIGESQRSEAPEKKLLNLN